ncbi:hypothetical protein [Pseudomonas syringae]|uniref:hypothetical protein n=1 Tax=Pseudomonas syringae TaxID=317 RepID=UPI0003713656|nr:hypothetical protein [Pseudomonas syringae]
MLADEYAANVVGFKTFTDYALSRVGRLPLQEFLVARAKYKIVEYLHSNGDNQKNDLVNLTFQGANPMGPKALSELRCAMVVVRKSAGKSSLVLAAGVTLSRFVSAISPPGIVAPVSFDWK